MSNTTQPANPLHGAPLPPPVIAYAVLTIAAAVVPTVVAGVSPWTSDAALTAFFHDHHAAVRLQALFAVAAAVPLAVLSAIVSDRIRVLGVEAPGRLIALVGGAVAAALLACSGMITLALQAVPAGPDDLTILRFGQAMATAFGGTAFAAFMGLLVAGVSVTGLFGSLLPRPVAWFGLAVAVIGELTLLVTLTDTLDVLMPVTRFGSLLFLLVAAFTLRKRRGGDRAVS